MPTARALSADGCPSLLPLCCTIFPVIVICVVIIRATPHNSLQDHGGIFATLVLLQKHLNTSSIHVFLRRAMSVNVSSCYLCALCGVALIYNTLLLFWQEGTGYFGVGFTQYLIEQEGRLIPIFSCSVAISAKMWPMPSAEHEQKGENRPLWPYPRSPESFCYLFQRFAPYLTGCRYTARMTNHRQIPRATPHNSLQHHRAFLPLWFCCKTLKYCTRFRHKRCLWVFDASCPPAIHPTPHHKVPG